jgi:hypothetical protein
VLGIGKTLSELTRSRSLRVMLGLMRKPAQLAGLDALQLFLETGFDRFAGMVRQGGVIQEFLDTIAQRESLWISQLFAADAARSRSHDGARVQPDRHANDRKCNKFVSMQIDK